MHAVRHCVGRGDLKVGEPGGGQAGATLGEGQRPGDTAHIVARTSSTWAHARVPGIRRSCARRWRRAGAHTAGCVPAEVAGTVLCVAHKAAASCECRRTLLWARCTGRRAAGRRGLVDIAAGRCDGDRPPNGTVRARRASSSSSGGGRADCWAGPVPARSRWGRRRRAPAGRRWPTAPAHRAQGAPAPVPGPTMDQH